MKNEKIKDIKCNEVVKRLDETLNHVENAKASIGIIPFEYEDQFNAMPVDAKTALVTLFDIVNYASKQLDIVRLMMASSLFNTKHIDKTTFLDILNKSEIDKTENLIDSKNLMTVTDKWNKKIFKEHDGNPIHALITDIKNSEGMHKQKGYADFFHSLGIDLADEKDKENDKKFPRGKNSTT